MSRSRRRDAVDATGNLRESVLTPITDAANAGDSVGLAGPAITHATPTSSRPASREWVFIDNVALSVAAVPWPASIASIAAIGLGRAARRGRKGSATSPAFA